MTWSTTQPGRDDDRIIPGVNQSIDAASPRPFHANCGRTTKPGEDQSFDAICPSLRHTRLACVAGLVAADAPSKPVRG